MIHYTVTDGFEDKKTMSSELIIKQLIKQIKLPAQDMPALAFCQDSRPVSVAQWANALPATRISNTSVLLYQALPEIVRLQTTAADRLAMLESLRPYVQQCIQGLAQNFLNQPLILPEGAMKTAVIAQALQKHMSNGYVVVFKDLLLKSLGKKLKPVEVDLLGLSLHRAITGCGLQFLRNAQLYASAPTKLWYELHALYQLAEIHELTRVSCVDSILKNQPANTIEQSYIRTLMLAAARPNQLRQTELLGLYDALEDWSTKIHLEEMNSESENLFVINADSNNPPMYKMHCEEGAEGVWRELDIRSIVTALEKHDSGSGDSSFIRIPKQLSAGVISHVCQSWGVARQRRSKRIPSHSALDVVIGLSSIHFHLSGEIPFTRFVFPQHDESSAQHRVHFESHGLTRENDPWSSAPDAEGQHNSMVSLDYMIDESEEEVDYTTKYPIFQTITSDASPEGYCLDWRDSISLAAKVGEVLGVREHGRKKWSIGVIRWVRQNKSSSQLGVQMLAPQARPYALKQIHTSGEHGEFMRALLVPEFKATKTPASLLVPLLPFHAGDKGIRNLHGEEESTLLIKLLFHTSSINQFSFRLLDATKNKSDKKQSDIEEGDDFADDW